MTTSGSRGPFLLSSVFAGAALGLVIYRFGVLPLGWSSPAHYVFTGLVIGLSVCARQFVKHREGRPATWMLVLGGLVGVAAAMGLAYLQVPPRGLARLHARELPGFAIQLPSGEDATASDELHYDTGKVMINNVDSTGGLVVVQWEVGVPAREDLEIAAKALGPSVGASVGPAMSVIEGPAETKIDMVTIDNDKAPLRMSFLPCGKRRILLGTMGGEGAERLHRRIAKTLVCHASTDEADLPVGLVPLHLDLPGWYATDRESNQVTLSDGRGVLFLKTIPKDSIGLEKMVAPMFNAMGWKIAVTGQIEGRILLTGTADGELMLGWARILACPTHSIMLIAFASDAPTAERIATESAAARCLSNGEHPRAWPDAPVAEPAPVEVPAAPATKRTR